MKHLFALWVLHIFPNLMKISASLVYKHLCITCVMFSVAQQLLLQAKQAPT